MAKVHCANATILFNGHPTRLPSLMAAAVLCGALTLLLPITAFY